MSANDDTAVTIKCPLFYAWRRLPSSLFTLPSKVLFDRGYYLFWLSKIRHSASTLNGSSAPVTENFSNTFTKPALTNVFPEFELY